VLSKTLCRRCAGPIIGLGVALWLSAPALADQTYAVEGKDSFTVGARDVRSNVVYTGKETLTSIRSGDGVRFAATVDYVRADQRNRAKVHSVFISLLKPSGAQIDERASDPDYVSVLNQPFSVALDLPTMRDVARITTAVPFAIPLPIASAPVNGSLRSCGDAYIAGERTLGIVFEAEGPIHGTLNTVGIALDGRVRMRGKAYYSYDTAVLRALDVQLTISGKLPDDPDRRLVTIVYRRSIRAVGPTPLKEAAH
jgi:hypothetical protein